MKQITCIVLFAICSAFAAYAQRGIPVATALAEIMLDTDPVILQLVQSVDSNQIISSLTRLEAFHTRYSGTDSLTSARDWLVAKFHGYGYTDVSLNPFTWNSRTLHNVVVTKQGTRFPDKFVLLVCHYDAISETPSTLAPGVNDNGSGVALTLEVARILATKQLDYSIRFICFSAEEQGLLGSAAYVNNVVVPENHDIKLLINVDEIGGYRGYTNTMVRAERDEDNNPPGNNQASAAYTDTLATLTRMYSTLTTTITQAYGSDYMSFEVRGYVITGFYEGQESPHYHHSTDNFANMDTQYLFQITRAGMAGVAYFGGIRRKMLTIDHSPQGTTQDTSHSVQLDAGIVTTSPITSALIRYRTNWSPAMQETTMVQTSSHGDSLGFRGWIPKQRYGTTVSYFLRFSSADSLTATFPHDTLAPVVFTVVPDTIPPGITHIPLGPRSYLDAPFSIQAFITDTNGVASASVTYRVNGGSENTVVLVQLTTDVWQGSIAGGVIAGDRVDYRITARDRSFSGNVATLPPSGWFSFRVLNSVLYDFESTNNGFVPSSDWQWGTIGTPDVPPPPHGQQVWGTNLSGNYSNNTESELISPPIDLTGKTNIVFTFKHFYGIEPRNDGGNVSVSVDSGAYNLLNPDGGYPVASVLALGGPGYSGNSFVWKDARFDIPSLRNHRVRFRFLFASDLMTSARGWYVDDVRIDYLDTLSAGISSPAAILPVETRLEQNYPNPFNPVTKIRFEIKNSTLTNLAIYDLLGREVVSIVHEVLAAGRYEKELNASNLSSGMYFCRLSAGGYAATKRILLLR